MKKALQWFEQLPEPIRTQAIYEWEKSSFSSKYYSFDSLVDALNHWEWDEYWIDIVHRAEAGEFPPNLHGWIPVSERLPTKDDADEFGKVLVLRDVIQSQINNCKSITDWNLVKHCDKETTMWQPLPKLPEVKS